MLKATIYERPEGKKTETDIRFVYPDDATWFIENNIQISMEEDVIPGNYIVYGLREGDDEEDEAIEVSLGRTCEETLKALRKQLEQ